MDPDCGGGSLPWRGVGAVALLPGSIVGAGTRDAVLILVLLRCGYDPPQALALSTLILSLSPASLAVVILERRPSDPSRDTHRSGCGRGRTCALRHLLASTESMVLVWDAMVDLRDGDRDHRQEFDDADLYPTQGTNVEGMEVRLMEAAAGLVEQRPAALRTTEFSSEEKERLRALGYAQ